MLWGQESGKSKVPPSPAVSSLSPPLWFWWVLKSYRAKAKLYLVQVAG